MRVLVADDDTAILALVRTALESWGMDVVGVWQAGNVISAWENDGPFDWAILDVTLGGADGQESARHLVERGMPVERVVLMTGLPGAFPPFRVLRKPFSLAYLHEVLERSKRNEAP